ncbi:MAG TPA: hypothetical protein VE991_13080, partial [Acidimicrobiales bacterium]|nr:hypothetical protein [Acidimicrobiales bacterium]
AAGAGMLVGPGELYGDAGADHVRIALVVTDEQVHTMVERLAHLDVGTAVAVPSRGGGGAR